MTALRESVSIADWKLGELEDYVGGRNGRSGLSAPSKMPGYGYGLPARECGTGSKLRAVTGSTCSGCYAMKGRYVFPEVQAALYRRLEAIEKPLWAPVMAELIGRRKQTYFRWHDSGDLQSVAHLAAIVEVCNLTPSVRHWLPTREYRIVSEYVESGGTIPPNLNVRLSAHMIGGHTPTFPRLQGLVTVSTVSRAADDYPGAHHCPAPTQGNQCGDCRACWDRGVSQVDYHVH